MGGHLSSSLGSFSEYQNNKKITDELKIYICGARKTGKTTLISRMKNLKFLYEYSPTLTITSYIFYWSPPKSPNSIFKVVVWECPPISEENNLSPENQTSNYNDQIFSDSNGIIVIYNPEDSSTIRYAQLLIENFSKTPFYLQKPVLLISNFLDRRKNLLKNAPFASKLQELSDLFINIQTSFLTNQGLNFILQWLDQPVLHCSKQKNMKQLSLIQDQLNAFEVQFRSQLSLYQNQLRYQSTWQQNLGSDANQKSIDDDDEATKFYNI